MNILIAIDSPFTIWTMPGAQVERLRRQFPHHTFTQAGSHEETLALIDGADVVLSAQLGPEHLARAERLVWIHSPAAGVGAMIFPEMVASPVVMTNSRGIPADTIAEHIIGVTLVLFRKFLVAFRSQAAREWGQNAIAALPPVRTIAGSRVLIVGLGAIGTAAARRLAALGAIVTGIRRRRAGGPPEGVSSVEGPERLRELLPSADVVVIAAPQTSDTAHLIGAAELSAMRRDAVLVNVSRGKLVDERALAAALSSGGIAAAALDVFEHEPLDAGSPLWTLPNVFITPHTSGIRPDLWEAVTDLFAENLRRFDNGQPLLNVVDKRAGY